MSRWLLVLCWAACCAQPPAEMLLADPALLADPDALPLAQGETAAVFHGRTGESAFNLHSYLAHYRGRYWAVWSSARVREEDSDQCIRYTTSRDGLKWSAPETLAADPDGAEGPARWIARGVYVEDGTLRALGASLESADYGRRGRDVVWRNLELILFEWNGRAWARQGVFARDCMNNFPPARLAGLSAMPCRDSRMDVFMALAERPGPDAWTRTPLAADPPFHRMDEPTLYETAGGYTHMILRDNNRSRRLLRALSYDHGRTWSLPVLTNYPDATSKNFTGRLPDGTYYLINNPHPDRRDPLVISFSPDGWTYSRPLAIRRREPSIQYPHALVHAGALWVIYSVNKRDIEIARLPLRQFPGH